MFYAIYKNLRDAAWQCLIDCKIDKLPVDVLKIAEQCNVYVIKNSHVDELRPNEDARTYCNGNKWVIIFNDKNDSETSRFAIAHELGHILLGHEKTYVQYSSMEQFLKKPKSEQQADMFALRLLCPACIIAALDLHSSDDIYSYCRVPLSRAEQRSERMKELYKRKKFFKSEIEKQVYTCFQEYIKTEKEKPSISDGIEN